jgi:DUF1365 family protein
MAVNGIHHSRIYHCRVTHHRLQPKQHRFNNNIFMFYLDLDELPALDQAFWMIGVNRPNWYSFRNQDHIPGALASSNHPTLKQAISEYLQAHGYPEPARVCLLTHMRTLGYVFNPVSFYFCYNANNEPLCAIAEVSNTFREMKPYILPFQPEQPHGIAFDATVEKYFYISPFSDLTTRMNFRVSLPDETFRIFVDELEAEQDDKILISVMTGKAEPLTPGNLIKMTLHYPLMPIQVIALIHWQALQLFLKGLKVRLKEANPTLQRDLYFPRFPLQLNQSTSHSPAYAVESVHSQGD